LVVLALSVARASHGGQQYSSPDVCGLNHRLCVIGAYYYASGNKEFVMNVLKRLNAGLLFFGLAMLAPTAFADDEDDLRDLLNDFLAGVSQAETHNRFWAEDLIYTSSAGTRTSKAEIMAGFGEEIDDEPGPAYSAEDVRIQLYGTTAVVAFRLVASGGDTEVQQYLNTGTFVKRGGIWRAAAWQATKMPAPD
jgi:hypothetical protein